MNPAKPFELAQPDDIAQQHSQQLLEHIIQQIQLSDGKIDFEQYMQLALYAPGLGYYSAGLHKFGAQGDFVTAPEISPLFAQVLAIQAEVVLEQIKQQTGQANLLEVGAGSGKMAGDILLELSQRKNLPDYYYILELSADLKQRQQTYLQKTLPDYYNQIIWLDKLPESGFNGLIIANELLDAFPVHLIKLDGEKIYERFVCENEGKLFFKDIESNTPEILLMKNKIQTSIEKNVQLLDKQTAYVTEMNSLANQWIESMAACLDCGAMLLIDYGYPVSEYLHPQRHKGTLMCHYKHLAHDDPFFYPGLQDITAHVNFSDIKNTAVAAKMQVSGYTTQAHFLLSGGLVELTQHIDINEIDKHSRMAVEIKKLTLPEEMGELFKVIYLTKDINCPLSGFKFNNMQHRL
ncbi:MAG: SAM-dependent methyltransferase [Pseudomonadota bacterium]